MEEQNEMLIMKVETNEILYMYVKRLAGYKNSMKNMDIEKVIGNSLYLNGEDR